MNSKIDLNGNQKLISKKVGIMTLYFNYNYGALLQAYALRQTIEELGLEAEDIRYYREIDGQSTYRTGRVSFAKRASAALKAVLKDPKLCSSYWYGVKKKWKAKERRTSEKIAQRHCFFDEFIKEEIKESTRSYDGHREITKSINEYDIFVCGSDNIWNKNLFDTAFMLDFVPDHRLKIAYAPGMSASALTNAEIDFIKPAMERIDYLSCRETVGAKVLSEIVGREVFVALDPTLLRTARQWQQIEKKPEGGFDDTKPYIFCYFCGNNRQHREQVKQLALARNLHIVTFPDLSGQYEEADDGFGWCRLYCAGPREFIYLIRNAAFVCTDSFHGSIFSVIFQREFVSFYRFSEHATSFLNTRIDNLFDLLGLPNERILKPGHMDILSAVKHAIDFNSVMEQLDTKRAWSLRYLSDSLWDCEHKKYRKEQ